MVITMKTDNMSKLYSYLEQNKPKIYPIKNKYLNNIPEEIRKNYFKMLAAFLHQKENISDSQKQLYKRLVVGAVNENTKEIIDFTENDFDFELEDFIAFVKFATKNNLKYRFIFDALVLICMEEKNKEQIKLLAYFCEELDVNKFELIYLSENAMAILEMDSIKFADAEIKRDNIYCELSKDIFYEYIEFTMDTAIFKGEKITLYSPVSQDKTTVCDLTEAQNSKTPSVKIIGIKINLDEFALSFKNKEQVIMESCVFTGGINNSLIFENCEKVILNNCSFENFSTFAIKFKKVKSLEITKTKFIGCIRKYHSQDAHWTSEGQVICSLDKEISDSVILEGCVFEDCGGQNTCERTKSAFICNSRVKADKCRFISCWNYRNCTDATREKDPEDRRRTMFMEGSLSVNCIFDDCALFC